MTTRDWQGGKKYFIDNAFLRTWGARLGPHCIAVYNVLAMHADSNSQTAYPSFQTIADLTGMSRRQVVREIEKLKANNIVLVEERTEIHPETGKPYFLSNIFTLLHPDEWVKIEDKSLRESSDTLSLGVMTGSHQSSDSLSPPLVTVSHLNNTQLNNTQLTKERVAPAPKFTPVPAVEIHREVFRDSNLTELQVKKIIEVVGCDPPALENWRNVLTEWNLAGYLAKTVKGQLDWYINGIPVHQNQQKASRNGHKPTKDQQQPTIPADPAEQARLKRMYEAAGHTPSAGPGRSPDSG